MKNLSILFAILIFLSCSSSEQKKDDKNNDTSTTTETNSTPEKNKPLTNEEIIQNIKTQYKVIMDAKSGGQLQLDSIEYACEDMPEFGYVNYFSKNDELVLIEHSYGVGDHGGGTDQYFLSNNKLFFQFTDEGYWTFDAQPNDDDMTHTVDYVTELRYYFNEKEEAIKCLEKKYEIRTADKKKVDKNMVSNKEIDCNKSNAVVQKFKKLVSLQKTDPSTWNCEWE